jgi:hypothetical protein
MTTLQIDQVEYARLCDFHDAWVEYELAMATGDSDLVKRKRRGLIAMHQAVNAARTLDYPAIAGRKP